MTMLGLCTSTQSKNFTGVATNCSLSGLFVLPFDKWIDLSGNKTVDSRDQRLVFVRRMRKAGSTTLRLFFTRLVEAAPRTNSSSGHVSHAYSIQANEFMSFNLQCLQEPLVRSRVLLVTHLREPLSRLNSEFYYVGPGSERGGSHPSNTATWMAWLDESSSRKANNTFESLIRGGLYLDNMYVRALTGDCSQKCLPKHYSFGANVPASTKNNRESRRGTQKEPNIELQLNDASFSRSSVVDSAVVELKGGIGGGNGQVYVDDVNQQANVRLPRTPPLLKSLSGCRLCRQKRCGVGVKGFRSTLEVKDLEAALEALEHFDLVVVTELLSDPAYANMVKALVRAPPTAAIGHARSAGSTSKPKPPAGLVTSRLKSENKLDTILYEEWRARADCALRADKWGI